VALGAIALELRTGEFANSRFTRLAVAPPAAERSAGVFVLDREDLREMVRRDLPELRELVEEQKLPAVMDRARAEARSGAGPAGLFRIAQRLTIRRTSSAGPRSGGPSSAGP
jgi:hypothetical protein